MRGINMPYDPSKPTQYEPRKSEQNEEYDHNNPRVRYTLNEMRKQDSSKEILGGFIALFFFVAIGVNLITIPIIIFIIVILISSIKSNLEASHENYKYDKKNK